MRIEMVEEEVTPTGDGARSERQEPINLRELDVRVAEKIMGWKHYQSPNGLKLTFFLSPEAYATHYIQSRHLVEVASGNEENAPHYSLSIATAFTVVEKLRAEGWSFACTLYEGKLPYASFCKKTVASSRNAEAATLPEAICLAALALVNSTDEEVK